MRLADYARLVALAAIWGASFLFMRLAAPVVGPALTTDGRLVVAGGALLAWMAWKGVRLHWRSRWLRYTAIGVVNAAIPFLLFAFAALHIPASISALLNSTAPMFGAVCGVFLLGERLSARTIAGLVLGFSGVALISRAEVGGSSDLFGWAVAACLVASLCYGAGGVMLQKYTAVVGIEGVAAGMLSAAAVVLLPSVVLWPAPALATTQAVLSVVALGLLCTALAYVLFVRLISDIGSTRAMTVTYLIPLFGLLWGALFLGETLPAGALAGGTLILAGTILVAGKRKATREN